MRAAAERTYRKVRINSGMKKAGINLLYFLCGGLSSCSAIFGSFSPFGVSYVSSVPFKYVLIALFGAGVGYVIFPTAGNNFRYIAAMVAAVAIRWTLNDIEKLRRHVLFSCLVAFVPLLATGFAMMSISGFDLNTAVYYTLEALIGGGCAYFFTKTVTMAHGTKSLGMLTPQELSCVVLTLSVALLAFSNILIGNLSLGRMLSVIIVLFCAKYGGISGGAVSGTAVGIVFSLSGQADLFLGAAYAFAGLLAGVFANKGRIASSVVFVVSCMIVALQTGDVTLFLRTLYEILISSAVFLILPKNTASFLNGIFIQKSDDRHCTELRKSVIMRLDFASRALEDVCNDIDEVSKKMSKLMTPNLNGVYQRAVENTCKRCGMRVFCWEHRDGMKMEMFQELSDKLNRDGTIEVEDFSVDFRRHCCRMSEMSESVNQAYKNYLAYRSAQRRVDEVRSVVAGQFCGLGEILGEMAKEYEEYEIFDKDSAQQICTALKDMGFVPMDINCRVDRFGRMTVELEIADVDAQKLKKALLYKTVSKICGRRFEVPSVTEAYGACRVLFAERACFDVEVGSSQHISGDGRLCGDHFMHFKDGTGRKVVVLSDGMGTGGRAAVDGIMASSIMSKLIQAGLGFECSLKVVNSALLVKSGDESLATLDVVAVDLYTGTMSLMKAGAAMTFVRHEKKTMSIEIPSLPAGILPDIQFSCKDISLETDDIVVMVSDGAVSTGEEWIQRIISSWEQKSMQELAEKITDEATARRHDGHDDDITVIAFKMIPNR